MPSAATNGGVADNTTEPRRLAAALPLVLDAPAITGVEAQDDGMELVGGKGGGVVDVPGARFGENGKGEEDFWAT